MGKTPTQRQGNIARMNKDRTRDISGDGASVLPIPSQPSKEEPRRGPLDPAPVEKGSRADKQRKTTGY